MAHVRQTTNWDVALEPKPLAPGGEVDEAVVPALQGQRGALAAVRPLDLSGAVR
jgi:hypothetical protein